MSEKVKVPNIGDFKELEIIEVLVKNGDKNKKGDPIYSVIGPDSSEHKIWPIEDELEINKIVSEVNSMGTLYIADGHHRSAAASRVSQEINESGTNDTKSHNFFLSVAFPHSEMNILDYNRIISGLNNYTSDELLNEINKNFIINNKEKDSIFALNQYVDHLARGLSLVCNILDPDVIVLGGGMSNIDFIYENINDALKKYVFTDTLHTKVVKNIHGDSSGVRGAAWLS